MSYDAVLEYRRERRTEKMRRYNVKHRASLKEREAPSARDVHQVAWCMLTQNDLDLRPFTSRLVGRLVEAGYDSSEATRVVGRMVGPRTSVDTSRPAFPAHKDD